MTDGRGRRRLRDGLAAAFESEPIEGGMDHPAERVIAAALDAGDADVVLRWIRSICLDSTKPTWWLDEYRRGVVGDLGG